MAVQFHVHNVAQVNQQLDALGGEIKTQGQKELLALGRLVEHSAEARAFTVRNMTVSWAQFDTRSVPNLVYVVPHQKGVRGKGPRKRQRFDNTLMNRVLLPALYANRPVVTRRYAALVDRVTKQFNKGTV